MADICYECLKRTLPDLKLTDAKMSKTETLCESCGKVKNLVIKLKGPKN